MSAFPLDEPHLAALRWACERVSLYGIRDALVTSGEMLGDDAGSNAIRALSSPASAASLVRDLLARAGVSSANKAVDDYVPEGAIDLWPVVLGRQGLRFQVPETRNETFPVMSIDAPDVPRLVSALANLAPGDREGATRALREAGR